MLKLIVISTLLLGIWLIYVKFIKKTTIDELKIIRPEFLEESRREQRHRLRQRKKYFKDK